MHTPWQLAFLIRSFEERLSGLFNQGKIPGPFHTCPGLEWSALALAKALRPTDFTVSNHRGHGYFLARHPDRIGSLLTELMSLREGLDGSQRLYAGNFLFNGIQGGMLPTAAGLALAYKTRRTNSVVTAFIGDDVTGEDVLYETMNFAALQRLPLIIILEADAYTQSNRTATTIADNIRTRAADLEFVHYKGCVWHPHDLCILAKDIVDGVRSGSGPALLEIECFPLNTLSEGDKTRPDELAEEYRSRDPFAVFTLQHPGLAQEYIVTAESLLDVVFAGVSLKPCSTAPSQPVEQRSISWYPAPSVSPRRIGEAIHCALRQNFELQSLAIAFGESIVLPNGDAFQIARDLDEHFLDHVFNEAIVTGICTGLALGGCLPLAEIKFGDSLTLAFDKPQQHAAKFHTSPGGRLRVPVTISTSMNDRRDSGSTHSPSPKKHFLGIPELGVVALNSRVASRTFYVALAMADRPYLVIENKNLSACSGTAPLPPGYTADWSDEVFPLLRIGPERGDTAVTIVCYGGVLEFVETALHELWSENETVCEVLCYGRLHPLNCTPLFESVRKTGTLLIVEEGPALASWGAEVFAQTAGSGIDPRHIMRLDYNGLIPPLTAPKAKIMPNAEAICKAVLWLMKKKQA